MPLHFDEDKSNRKLKDLHQREEEGLAQMLAGKYGIEYVDLSPIPINTDALRLVNETEAREGNLAVFGITDKRIKVAVLSPQQEFTELVIKKLQSQGYEPTLHLTTHASLEKAWNLYKSISYAEVTKAGALDIANEEITTIITKIRSLTDVQALVQDVLSQSKSYRTSRIVEIIIAGALATSASDIHIEPEQGYIRLRYRLDGVLVDVIHFDAETYGLLLSRIKLLSGLKLNIKQESQDGRFSVKLHDQDIEIRTSLLPGAYNESIVLRVLNPKTIAVPMDELGIETRLLKILEHEISKPEGMILTTGPTGSGKTTSLYAFLKKVHNPTIKIITIEDPIEYHLPGIVQTQVNEKGYNFLEGLRSALRQDPDVIMVGEIRDSETAKIAVNAAQTGHLVFSTLHTNNAAGTFPRLIDLGVDPRILTSAINIAIAQRLLRKLCAHCKKEVPIEGEDKKLIEAIISNIHEKNYVPKEWHLFEPVGCAECNKTGYKGRIGIYEAILNDETIENLMKAGDISERAIKQASKAQGILTLEEDGILKILTGVTSLQELKRVVDIEEAVN